MTSFQVTYHDKAVKQLLKLDKHTRKFLYAWIEKYLQNCEDPRRYGKGLAAEPQGLWCYRVGDYRLIAEIQDEATVILILGIWRPKETIHLK